jgi:hypothetical protein
MPGEDDSAQEICVTVVFKARFYVSLCSHEERLAPPLESTVHMSKTSAMQVCTPLVFAANFSEIGINAVITNG